MKKIALVVIGGISTLGANSAMAATDYTSLTGAADWTSAATAVIVVFAALAVVLIALKGGRAVLAAFR